MILHEEIVPRSVVLRLTFKTVNRKIKICSKTLNTLNRLKIHHQICSLQMRFLFSNELLIN